MGQATVIRERESVIAWMFFNCLHLWYLVHNVLLNQFLQSTLLVQENQELLIKCIAQNLGFSGGKPVAACVIYKCLLHWRSFEVERTSVFDRVIQTIASAIEVKFLIWVFKNQVSLLLFYIILYCLWFWSYLKQAVDKLTRQGWFGYLFYLIEGPR